MLPAFQLSTSSLHSTPQSMSGSSKVCEKINAKKIVCAIRMSHTDLGIIIAMLSRWRDSWGESKD